MGSQQSEAAINHLVETIGLNDACELLQSTHHLITNRKNQLVIALRQNDMAAARRCVHKTIGSIRIYGSERLEVMLSDIANKPLQIINTVAFQQELQVEFESVISVVDMWLTKNCNDDHSG